MSSGSSPGWHWLNRIIALTMAPSSHGARRARLPSGPAGRPLLDERVEALTVVVAPHGLAHPLARTAPSLLVGAKRAIGHDGPRFAHGDRRVGEHACGELDGAVQGTAVVTQDVDQPEPVGALGGDGVARERALHGHVERDLAAQAEQ